MTRSVATVVILAAVLGTSMINSGHAGANDAGVSPANFSESRGCSPFSSGISRPYVSGTGSMSVNERIRGPWGDMFGRTYYQVRDSLVTWALPGSSKTLRVHERAIPALELAAAALAPHISGGEGYGIYSAFAWNWRTVGGTFRPSEHAFGTAFDVNPDSNPYSRDNILRTDLPEWFVDSFVEAGFCWGGLWVDAKDAMHFSWSGPGQTPAYPARLPPYPAVTVPTDFTNRLLRFDSIIGWSEGTSMTIADMTGEGAPDVVQVASSGLIEAAGAVGDYAQVAFRSYAGSGSADAMIGDYDLDGVADSWIPNRTGDNVSMEVWVGAQDHQTKVDVSTNIPSDAGHLLLGYYDSDYVPDIYALTGSSFVVYGSMGGYSAPVGQLPLVAGSDPSWHFASGDHDLDGRADVYAVSNAGAPTMSVRLASGGSASYSPAVNVTKNSMVEVGDYDGDGRDDLYVLTGSDLTIALGGNSSGAPDSWFQLGSTVPPDAGPRCDGPQLCDSIGYVDSGGVWTLADRPRTNPDETAFYFGNPGDESFSGDWNCDGIDTPGLYRQSDGFVYLRQSNTQGNADLEFYFGDPGDVPLIGDFNGDGCDTVAVFRSSEHRMYIINSLGEDREGLGTADFYFTFGNPGDIPFVGDFDGDGVDEIGLRRPSTGRTLLRWELENGIADFEFLYGIPGDIPLAGDWNGDGVDTVAVFRPSTGSWYLRLENVAGAADHVIRFGDSGSPTQPIHGMFGP